MEFKDLLERVLGRHHGFPLKLETLKECPGSKTGQNFMSVVSSVHVEGQFLNGTPYSHRVFLKRPLPSHSLCADAFANEVFMYTTVLPLITAAHDVTGVPYPPCYHAEPGVIVLEDMTALGYGVGDVIRGFDVELAKRVVETLAQFHAASYYTSIVKKEVFFKIIQNLKPMGLAISSNETVVEESVERAIRCLEAEDDLRGVATYLKTSQGKIIEKMRELTSPKHYGVLIHGDFWFNNILTRLEDVQNDKSNDLYIIDFQSCSYQSPAVDFWLFLYTSVSPSLSSHFDDFIRIYCSKFDEVLGKITSEIEIDPVALTEELKSKELYGVLAATAYLPALFLKRDLLEKASEEEKREEGAFEKFIGPGFEERLIEVERNPKNNRCKKPGRECFGVQMALRVLAVHLDYRAAKTGPLLEEIYGETGQGTPYEMKYERASYLEKPLGRKICYEFY